MLDKLTSVESALKLILALETSPELRKAALSPEGRPGKGRLRLEPGQFFLALPRPGLIVVGYVRRPMNMVETMQQIALERHFGDALFAKQYSELCPRGELGGIVPETIVAQLTEEVFDALKARCRKRALEAVGETARELGGDSLPDGAGVSEDGLATGAFSGGLRTQVGKA